MVEMDCPELEDMVNLKKRDSNTVNGLSLEILEEF